jgi:hypothetical protein
LKAYGLTNAAFLEILERQGFRCAACGVAVDESSPVDHCHLSGQVRAVLCRSCNTTLGIFDESQARLRGLVSYLHRTKQLRLFAAKGGK